MRLLSLSGLIPEQICDTVRFTQYPGERNVSNFCGYALDFISQVKQDKTIDGAVFPKTCDSCRTIGSYLSDCGKFVYQLGVPARQDSFAVKYFAEQIKAYKKALEVNFSDFIDCVAERTELINQRNGGLKEIYESLDTLSYFEYLGAMHEMLASPLSEQMLPVLHRRNNAGKRVWLVGSFLANIKVAELVENAGMTVVGDNLPESGRIAHMPMVETGEHLYENISKSILENRVSPTQNNFARLLMDDLSEICTKRAEGVIFVMQQYCEPYHYLFSVYKKMLDENGIPVLKLVLSDSEDSKKASLLLESFADIL